MIRALILATDHRVYKGTWQKAENLAALKEKLKAEGMLLDGPCGIKLPSFCFLYPGHLLGESEGSTYRNPDWVPLAEVLTKNEDIWHFYCESMLGGWHPPKKELDVFFFGTPGLLSSKLAHLVTKGGKRLTAGWISSHLKSGAAIPAAGWVSIVTDSFGIPVACIETEEVKKLKFKDVTEEMAYREGEGDLTLSDWRLGHWDYWVTNDAKRLDLTFSENEEIFVEYFRLLQVFSGKSEWDRPQVTMIFGPTGSGKSTLARKISSERKLHLFSIDEWMRNLFWRDATPDSNLEWALERCARCETVITNLLKRELELGRGAVLDLGFSKVEERSSWKKRAEDLGAHVEVRFVDAPRDVRWARVEARNQNLAKDQSSINVDRATFDWMESFFEPPTNDELRTYKR